MIGYEDVVSLSKSYSSTVRCISVTADILVMNSKDFISRVNIYQDTWNQMKDSAKSKQRYAMSQNNLNQAIFKVQSSKTQSKEVPVDNQIKSMDFFNNMFGGNPIPENKIQRILAEKEDIPPCLPSAEIGVELVMKKAFKERLR